ncbi:DNRLRE domain-containing protein, partial [Actinoplanes sp. NPDC051861]|uniref:DNRLRE domain-containing protein n=1 Tax=Actinoplanes sp. NPDC051861 TaxID=3155170 RepID=UPI003439239E
MRTRARLVCTSGLLVAALTAASVPWWPDAPAPSTPAVSAPVFKDQAAALAEAVQKGTEVLVETATTATSLTWVKPTGELRSQINALPQRAKTAAGVWAPIDNTLARDGSVVRPANPPVPVSFSNGSDNTEESVLAEVQAGGHTVAYTWPGRLPEPVIDGSRALYQEVLPGIDLLVTVRAEGGFGHVLIVKNRTAKLPPLSYGLRADGVIFRHDAATNGVKILDAGSKDEVGVIPTSLAWDSAGKEPRTSVASASDVLKLSGLDGLEPGSKQAVMPSRLDGDGTGSARLHLDAAATGLLTDPSVTFPVFLDPSIIAGDQAWIFVSKSHPNSNFLDGKNYNGGTTEARVGHEDDSGVTARSFWRMGYRNIKDAKVSTATFKVKNIHSWSCTKRTFQLWHTGTISSGTTWNKQPGWTTQQDSKDFAYGYGSSCADEFVSFNIKAAAQLGADNGATNITFGMRTTAETDTQTWRKFDAGSAQIDVVYNTPPAEPTGGVSAPGGNCSAGATGAKGLTVGRTNITLSAQSTDKDDNLKNLRFVFWKSGTTVPADRVVAVTEVANQPLAGKASVTIPYTELVDGTTYSWAVRAEDATGVMSTYYPAGNDTCLLTIDGTKPSPPTVESDVWLEATPDGMTWAKPKFGETGPITFTSAGATKFEYSFEYIKPTTTNATNGSLTVPNLAPRHSGPNTLVVYAIDAAGNKSLATTYTFYVAPKDTADKPGDVSGDGRPDLIVVDANGKLLSLPGDENGELYGSLAAAYTSDGKLNPANHWYEAGKLAPLIAKHSDTYPGDGTTDLFARTPDGNFWLYPGDGYGSFNVDQRLKVVLPSGAPAPSTWTQIKALGDITGDKLPDLAVRSGTAFWLLSGYTAAAFQQATLMDGTNWGRAEIVNIADI